MSAKKTVLAVFAYLNERKKKLLKCVLFLHVIFSLHSVAQYLASKMLPQKDSSQVFVVVHGLLKVIFNSNKFPFNIQCLNSEINVNSFYLDF